MSNVRTWLGQIMTLLTTVLTLPFLYLLLTTEIAKQVVVYFVGQLGPELSKLLLEKDKNQFWLVFGKGLGILMGNAALLAFATYCEKSLYITFRQKLTDKTMKRYFHQFAFYYVNNSGLDNVDQRLTMDIDKFCLLSAQVLRVVLITPFTLAWYIYKCYEVTSWWGPLACFLFFLVGSIINNLAMPLVVRESKQVEACEGDYRWQHARVRHAAELVAMSRAGEFERENTQKKGHSLFRQQIRLERYSMILNLTVNLFDYVGGIFSYMCLAPLIFAGDYDDKTEAELAQIIGQTTFVVIYLVNQFTRLFDQIRNMADILACGKRISEVYFSPGMVDQGEEEESDSDLISNEQVIRDSRTEQTEQEALLTVFETTVNRFGSSQPLIDKLTLTIDTYRDSVLIVGGNGLGKSTFFRACSGLWPCSQGSFKLPAKVMFVQDAPALTDGTLMEQLTYPLSPSSYFPSEATQSLKVVGLGHLVGSLNEKAKWDSVLSQGERQMISFARIHLHKPRLVFLDESSSALTLNREREMYELMLNEHIGFISISHRPDNLKQYHARVLHFKRDGANYWQQWEKKLD